MTASKTQRRAGFTLLEVIVIVAILGLLAGIVFPSVMGTMEKAQIGTAGTQLKSIANTVDLFYKDSGRLPTAEEGLRALWEKPEDLENYPADGYLRTALGKDPWGSDYIYELGEPGENGVVKTFQLRSPGPTREDEQGEGDDIVWPKPVDEEDL